MFCLELLIFLLCAFSLSNNVNEASLVLAPLSKLIVNTMARQCLDI
jgi:hypothetical protein